MLTKNNKIKCDWCGQFISYMDLDSNKAYNKMITPYSDISFEEMESKCKKCIENEK